jgi:hypothetical protein
MLACMSEHEAGTESATLLLRDSDLSEALLSVAVDVFYRTDFRSADEEELASLIVKAIRAMMQEHLAPSSVADRPILSSV